MSTLLYAANIAPFGVTFALAALPIASVARLTDPQLNGFVPPRWGVSKAALFALGCVGAVLGLLVFGAPLETCAQVLVSDAVGGGRAGLWARLAAVGGRLLAEGGHLGWRLLVLAGPALVALHVVARRRWAARALAALTILAMWPVVGTALMGLVSPVGGPAREALIGVSLWAVPMVLPLVVGHRQRTQLAEALARAWRLSRGEVAPQVVVLEPTVALKPLEPTVALKPWRAPPTVVSVVPSQLAYALHDAPFDDAETVGCPPPTAVFRRRPAGHA